MTGITLFSSIKLGHHTLPNRIAMAPLTRCRAVNGHVPGPLTVEYYKQRASAGLIITEGSQISPQGVGYMNTPGIHSPEQAIGWGLVTKAVHEQGGHIYLQLWHVGRVSHPSFQPGGATPVAPSSIRPAGQVYTAQGPQDYVTPHALSVEEIAAIVEDFRRATRNARAAGFDGVEIHGANGYLLDQFLRDGSNQRTDAYGGSIENRARLLLEVTEAVCQVWDNQRVGVRLSPLQPVHSMHDSNPEATFSHVVEKLNRYNLAYLHVAEMGKDNPGAAGPAFDLTKLRHLWKGVYIANCGYTRDSGNQAIAGGHADMIAYGVPFIANPDLVQRFSKNAALNPPDQSTFYGGGEKGYTDYPALNPA